MGIANSLDLTHRFLPLLGARRCKPERLNFSAYGAKQIQAILEGRMWSATLEPGSAVEVLLLSGDAFAPGRITAVHSGSRGSDDLLDVEVTGGRGGGDRGGRGGKDAGEARLLLRDVPLEFIRRPSSGASGASGVSGASGGAAERARAAGKGGSSTSKKRKKAPAAAAGANTATVADVAASTEAPGTLTAALAPAAIEFCARKVSVAERLALD